MQIPITNDPVECPQFQELLCNSFGRNIDSFRSALSHGADVNKRESGDKYSIFEKACATPNCDDYIKACLDHEASVTIINPTQKTFPIHLVALCCSDENMRALLTSPDVVVDQKYQDRTALYLLFENINEDNHQKAFECIKLLLVAGANINAVQKDNVSPVQLLLEKVANGQVPSGENEWPKDVLQYCLKESAVNLCLNDGKAQTLIKQCFPTLAKEYGMDMAYPKGYGMSTVTVEGLKDILSSGTMDEFNQIFEEFKNCSRTLNDEELKDMLDIAVVSDKLKAAECLVSPRLDAINETIPENLLEILLPGLLEKCCNRGFYSVLEWLLKIIPQTARDFINKEPLLCILIKRMYAKVYLKNRSFSDCFYLLLQDHRIEIDKPDEASHRTALHYAVMYKMQPVQLALLGKGAQLGLRDILRNFCEIDPILLEKHFDTRLSKTIVCDSSEQNQRDEEFDVTIDLSDFTKSTSATSEINCQSEIYPILQLAQHPANKRLLQHPLISIILQLKLEYLWQANLVYFVYHCIHWICLTWFMVYCNDILGLGRMIDTSIMIFVAVYTIGRMVMSCAIDKEHFLQRCENWLQIMLIIVLICAIVVKESFAVHEEIYRSCCATAVMLLSVEFTVVLGKVSFLGISTNLIMLKTISINFCKSLISFPSILIAWALVFHILFKHRHHTDPATLVTKTMVMMTGEFDATNIPFAESVFKNVLFLMFVIFVALVLNNFINGLAVDDTITMRAESEYISLKQKIFLIHRLETILNLRRTWANYISSTLNWPWLSQENTTINLPPSIKILQNSPNTNAQYGDILKRSQEILNSYAEPYYVNAETTNNLNDSAAR
ncbi:transient receptor potential cation channel protein painless-like isoform X2 [Anopheles bellator]|uniref:transient receptor potential cation channel protein painless-like isoform X2 n=1 Tax=Anopheles bellator TaxID=139047 RepID=UPI002648A473|nr:transient receptor potential cation channel protein painless-like isoform X2 [Anopheles bellator]